MQLSALLSDLCSCFSPQIRQNLVGYLSSQQMNQQVIQQEKCTEQIRDEEDSIYSQAKAKSFYTLGSQDRRKYSNSKHNQKNQSNKQNRLKKLSKLSDHDHQDDHYEHQDGMLPHQDNQIQFEDDQDDEFDPSWYPTQKQMDSMTYDEIYQSKLKTLKHILSQDIDEIYQKVPFIFNCEVYDSQDEIRLVIHAKGQLEKGKKHNVYRFRFVIPAGDEPTTPEDYLNASTKTEQGKSLTEALLKKLDILKTEASGLQLCYRAYEKKLVISQHDFVTAEKTFLEQQLDEDLSSQGKQIYNDIVYSTMFSIKGFKDQKSVVFNRGHINLIGMKVELVPKITKTEQKSSENQISQQKQLTFTGYLNVELDTTVNSNMLRQPASKEIRSYVQKLTCLLQKSDAI